VGELPFAEYTDFDDCLEKQMQKGHSEESAKKICGAIKHQTEGKSNMNDCHAEDGKFCETGGSGGSSMPKSGSGTSRPSVGIVREGKAWKTSDGKDLPKHLEGLKIPPAWTGTQVNPDPEGSLLVTGYDANGRLQYVYSQKYMDTQKAAKFARISELDREFDGIKSANEANRADPAKAEEADCMRVIMETGIRPGSDRDTKAAKQAYGATTLRGEHVVQTKEGVRLQYTGKKGVDLDIPIENPETAAMLVSRAEAAGADGRLFDTDSHTLLQYSHTLGSGQFKVKDMRTYVGTSLAKDVIKGMPAPTTKTAYKKSVSAVAKAVSTKLGNTPSMALKAYIAPEVFDAWNSEGAFAHSATSPEPLFDFSIMVGTACKLRERPVTTKVIDDIDPEGNDEDGPTPKDVRLALGFDPDEIDSEGKSNQGPACGCVGDHCFFGNNVEIAPDEHIAVLQGLNTWIDYARPTGPQRFYYGADDFRGTEAGLLTTPVIFAQQHPEHRLVTSDLNNALASVQAHDGGPGRIAGSIRTPLIVGDEAQPDLMAEVVFDDPYVQRMHAERRLKLSTAFTAGHDDTGHLTEKPTWNHLLVFVDGTPRDPATGFLNKEGSDVTDGVNQDAPAGDKSAPAKPEAKAPGSTEMRLKALIGDLLSKLDEVFGSAEQLSEEAGDSGDPDPAVSGKGQAPDEEEKDPAKANMNENHDESGRFASGGGSSGGRSLSAMSKRAFERREALDRGENPRIPEIDRGKVAADFKEKIISDIHSGSVPAVGQDLYDAEINQFARDYRVGVPLSELKTEHTQKLGRAKSEAASIKNWMAGKSESTHGREYRDQNIAEAKQRGLAATHERILKEIGSLLGGDKSHAFDNADYPWDDCIADQLKKGYDQTKAEKICGYIKAKNNLQEMMSGRSPDGSDSEEDIMGTEMDALKSKLDAANKELDSKKKELDAANQKLAEVAQAEKDAAWENMKTSHVPKGWLAGATDEEKANKEKALRQEFETAPVGFANKLLAEMKGKGKGQDMSKEEGNQFGNKDAPTDAIAVSRELRALSGR